MSDFGMKDFAYCVFMNSARWRKLLYSWRLNTSACDQAIIGVLASSVNQRQNVNVCSKENNRCIWRCRSKINKEGIRRCFQKKKKDPLICILEIIRLDTLHYLSKENKMQTQIESDPQKSVRDIEEQKYVHYSKSSCHLPAFM